ncbi:MAG: hypothetical protein ACLQAT_12565 [Candidatus Binataceae bacterium]
MKDGLQVEDLILNYDPEFPQARFLSAGVEGALRSSTGRLPSTVAWPDASKPIPLPLDPPPREADDLTRFRGYDAVVVTWTAAEAAALAALLTPDYLPSRWYEYRHNVNAYIPLVTGSRSPFNDKSKDMARYLSQPWPLFPLPYRRCASLTYQVGASP